MDFTDSPEEAAYRSKAKTWLETNAPKFARATASVSEESDGEVDWEDMKRAKAWQARKAEGGYAQITWPKEWGGGGGTPIQSVIFGQEEAKFDVGGGYFAIGLGMCVPTVMAFADDATKARFVGPALRGEEIWCQLFSEPGGGSDVAAARTRAVRDGDDWVINGQKVWTSGAHYADFGIVIVRTNPDVPKHKGLTMFWLDMASPGIDVKPIHQMSGGRNFNEVYLHRRAGEGQPAPGRGRRRLAGLAGDADERAAGRRRGRRPRLLRHHVAGARAADATRARRSPTRRSARNWPTGTCSPRG